MIRIVSNVHVDRGGDGDECSSVRVRRLRSATFFVGGRKNSESRGTGESPWVDQTAKGEGRKEQTETLRVDVRKQRLQATGTRNVYASRARERDTRSLIVCLSLCTRSQPRVYIAPGRTAIFFAAIFVPPSHATCCFRCVLVSSLRSPAGYTLWRTVCA